MMYVVNYLALGIICTLYKLNSLNKKVACILFASLQIAIIGLRHPLMGLHDTQFVFLRNLGRIYHFGIDFVIDNTKDRLFQFLSYFFTRIFGLNEPLYVFLFSVPYVIAIAYLIYKYSNNIFLSFILFTSTSMFTTSFTLMRQINATSMLIFAFIALNHKKIKSFYILVTIASFFHLVAVVFFAVPILLKYFNKKITAIILPLSGFMLAVFFGPFVGQFVHFVVDINDRFTHMVTRRQGNNLTPFFVFLTILLATAFFSSKGKDMFLKKCVTVSSLGVFFLPLAIVNREFARVGSPFLPFLLIAYPNALNYIKGEKYKLTIQILSVLVFIGYFLFFLIHTTGLYPYVPFWGEYPI